MALSPNSRSARLHDKDSSRDKSTRPTIARVQPVVGLLDLPNELLLEIFRDVAKFTLDPRNVELGIFLRKRRSIRTFLGYGLNKQLLPVIREALFTELRPIMRCTHMPQDGHESYLIEYPYFDLYGPTQGHISLALNFSKLERSRWTAELRYLRVEIPLISPISSDVVKETLGIAAGIAIHFRALSGLEVKIEESYGRSIQAGNTEEVMAADLRRKLEEKGCERRVEVTVKFRGHGDSWVEGKGYW